MTELRAIKVKHKRDDAEMIRRVVSKLDKRRKTDADLLHVLLYLANTARLIDEAFKPAAAEAPKDAA